MDHRVAEVAKKLLKHNQRGAELENQLVAALNAAKMSAREIAEEIGVSQQYLSDIKKGRRTVSREFVERIAR